MLSSKDYYYSVIGTAAIQKPPPREPFWSPEVIATVGLFVATVAWKSFEKYVLKPYSELKARDLQLAEKFIELSEQLILVSSATEKLVDRVENIERQLDHIKTTVRSRLDLGEDKDEHLYTNLLTLFRMIGESESKLEDIESFLETVEFPHGFSVDGKPFRAFYRRKSTCISDSNARLMDYLVNGYNSLKVKREEHSQ